MTKTVVILDESTKKHLQGFSSQMLRGGAEPRSNSVEIPMDFIRNLPLTEVKIPNSLRKSFLIGRRAIKKLENINEL